MRQRWNKEGGSDGSPGSSHAIIDLGVIYHRYSNEERKALKKIRADPKERLVVIANKVTEELARSNVKLEPVVYTVTEGNRHTRKNNNKKNAPQRMKVIRGAKTRLQKRKKKVNQIRKETPGEITLMVDRETGEEDVEQDEEIHPQP